MTRTTNSFAINKKKSLVVERSRSHIMKTILNTITTITIACLAVTTAMAQVESPQPPEPPSTSVSVHSDDTKSSTSYSYSLSDDDDKGSGGNVSISTSSTDDSYSFRLRYDGSKDDQIKKLLYKEMGTNNLKRSGGKDVWVTTSGGDEVYEIKFSEGRLRMDLDKEVASEAITTKIVALGKSVRTIITGQRDQDRKAERLQREADRLQRDADRMRREADRLQQQEQRNIDRIKREADRLRRDAERAGENAQKNGGVSSIVTEILYDSKTRYDGIDRGTAWVLPKLLPLLSEQLMADGFLKSQDDLNILKEENGMYVNGIRVSSSKMGNYNTLFKKHGIANEFSFSLNKNETNIVFVDDNADIEDILEALRANNHIPQGDKKLMLELNGNSIIMNGEQLSTSQVTLINKLLLKYNVIPAPGKTLQIRRTGNYTLGYSRDNGRTHLGTWVMGR